MNRRNFLNTIIGGLTATAAIQAWPFRIYSFPDKISIESRELLLLARGWRPLLLKPPVAWDELANCWIPSPKTEKAMLSLGWKVSRDHVLAGWVPREWIYE